MGITLALMVWQPRFNGGFQFLGWDRLRRQARQEARSEAKRPRGCGICRDIWEEPLHVIIMRARPKPKKRWRNTTIPDMQDRGIRE